MSVLEWIGFVVVSVGILAGIAWSLGILKVEGSVKVERGGK